MDNRTWRGRRAALVLTVVVLLALGLAPTARSTAQTENDDLGATLDAILADDEGVYGVAIMAADGSMLYGHNPDVPFLPASIYKLLVIAEVYRLRETGELRFDEKLPIDPDAFESEVPGEPMDGYYPLDTEETTVDEAIEGMIVYSSNVAAITLLARVGRPAAAAMASRLGMTNTHYWTDPAKLPGWPPPTGADGSEDASAAAVTFVVAQAERGPVNVTTPRDIATYFVRLVNGEVVSPDASAEILDLLKRQLIRDRIPAWLPDGIEVADKPGNLDNVVNDAAAIFTPAGPLIVAVLTLAVPDEFHAAEVIRLVAITAYERAVLPADADGDGLLDAAEAEIGTDPADADSDDDGANDGAERLVFDTEPLDPSSSPNPALDTADIGTTDGEADDDSGGGGTVAESKE